MIILFPNNCFIAGLNPLSAEASLFAFWTSPSDTNEGAILVSFAEGLGAVGGFSLKKMTIITATTIPMIAWHSKEEKI